MDINHDQENAMINKKAKFSLLTVLITSVYMGFVLQGCNATTGGMLQNSNSGNVDNRNISELFNNGISIYLMNIAQGYKMAVTKDDKITKKALLVSQPSFLRDVILKSKRGKQLRNCQFVAMRVETDGKPETTEWLATTKGQGICQTDKGNIPKYFWLIQQKSGSSPLVLLSGMGTLIQIVGHENGAKDGSWNKIMTRNSAKIQGASIACYNEYAMKNGYYQQTSKRVEAYKPTGSMLNAHTSEMSWEEVTDPKYQCPS